MRAFVSCWVVGLVLGCGPDPSFDERAAELEADTPTYCGTMNGQCDFPATAEPLLQCLQNNLAARTGAWAREESPVRIRNYYAIDGELIVLEETYDAQLDIVWTEQHFCSVSYHPAGDCISIEPVRCE